MMNRHFKKHQATDKRTKANMPRLGNGRFGAEVLWANDVSAKTCGFFLILKKHFNIDLGCQNCDKMPISIILLKLY